MLAVEDLSFAYRRGAEELFGGLSHVFTPGQVTALTGPSGRGKSTLLYMLGLMLTRYLLRTPEARGAGHQVRHD